MTALTLGPVDFDAFEVPGRIEFGGGQRLAVHALPGGVRVIDALGPEDAPIHWSGVFTGPSAGERVRLLNVLRSTGEPLPLAWDDFVYEVIVAGLEVRFERPNWIPYRIACMVLSDLSSPLQLAMSLAASIGGDLRSAGAYNALDLSGAGAALVVPGATTLGSLAYGQATLSLAGAVAQAVGLRDAGGESLGRARTVTEVAVAAGEMAQASAASGYLRRAQGNLARTGS